MKTYQGCLVHPSSHLHTLIEQAEKTGDWKRVKEHYALLEKAWMDQCGFLPPKPWQIGYTPESERHGLYIGKP